MSPLTESTRLTLAKSFTWNESVWNPSMISTVLWLDANDSATITQSSGAVSQWNDKSGNGRNFTQSTSANRPTYASTGLNNKPTLEFGADDFMELTSGLISQLYTIVCVANASSLSTNSVLFAGGSKVNSNPRQQLDRDNTTLRVINRNDGGTITDATQGTITSAAYIQTGTQSSTLAGVSLNGNTLTTAAAVTGTTSITVYTIGALFPGSSTAGAFHNGDISEIVYVAGEPSTSTRQRIEGYLAWKWGLTSNLPAGHPYKTIGPTP